MKRHITNRELARYIAGAMSNRKRTSVAEHLTQCDRCRARHEKMLAVIAPRYFSLRASDAAKVRVMRSRDKLAEGEDAYAPGGIRSILSLHPRAFIAASLALVTAVAVTAALLLRPPAGEARLHLAAVIADAGVTINDHPVRDRDKVFEQSAIILPDKTTMRLEYGRGFSITLIGPAIFSIDRLMSRGPSEPVVVECTLAQGLLVSASDGTGKKVAYTYNTPDARVEPVGTEFLLQSAGGTTLVVMKTGSVRVKPERSAESVAVSSGNRCMVAEKTEISKADPEDLKIFGSMEQLRAGAFGHRLLKPEPLGKDTELEHKRFKGRLIDHKQIHGNSKRKLQLETPDNRDKERGKSLRRDKIISPVKPGMREKDRINKNKKLIRNAQKAIRQKRRTSR